MTIHKMMNYISLINKIERAPVINDDE